MAAASSVSSSGDNYGSLFECRLVWLDTKIRSVKNQSVAKRLRRIDPNTVLFSEEDECLAFIEKSNESSKVPFIYFIISGSLSKQVLPKIHDLRCIYVVFIFCMYRDQYTDLQFSKLQDICVDSKELVKCIEECIAESIRDVDFSLFDNCNSRSEESSSSDNTTGNQYNFRNLRTDQIRFLWFSQLARYLTKLRHDDDQQAKQEFIDYCRKQYDKYDRQQEEIDRFESESIEQNMEQVIEWYTSNTFVFRCVNAMLRKENIAILYSCRYFVRMLCLELQDEHPKFIQNYQNPAKGARNSTLIVYRGQKLKLEDIQLLGRHRTYSIVLNGFISTTLNRDRAIKFSLRKGPGDDYERVLFEIDIDMADAENTAFADISERSHYPSEKEVLFTIGTIFRIESTRYDKRLQLYIINLKLTSHTKTSINNYINQTYAAQIVSANSSLVFGKLLLDMREYTTALQFFNDLLQRSLNDQNERATCLNSIGVCYNHMEETDKALENYQKALKLYKQTSNSRGMGASLYNIATIYYAQGEITDALNYALEASNTKKQHELERASIFDLLGRIYLNKGQEEAALSNFQESFELRRNYFGEHDINHPDIGRSLFNFGKLFLKKLLLDDAQRNFSQAARIFSHNYPPSHPLVVEVKKFLEQIQRQLRNF